ncbi:putative ABC multidrug transporter [Aspergillus steynii IBT 23096]|uniref:Putative ABC multidrug transporter n=1 Tax=Aspergillus steynii IBT 23096 TaxID=1392250 RepID=A0A2I2GP83_9EURO|nr:putative ABC multidrug transporter [Aspergillus steynii IBT 23096]PLB54684.1 putative ABC multidrug transporter [Aspergillus steynii IBT 23096]
MTYNAQEKIAIPIADEKNESQFTSARTSVQESRPSDQPKQSWFSKLPSLNPLRWQKTPPIAEERGACREYEARLPSRMFFQWIEPIMKVGYLRDLELQDIWAVNPDRSVDFVSKELGASLERRLKRGDKKPLVGAIYETFKREFWIGAICQILGTVIIVLSPLVIRHLISFAMEAYDSRNGTQPSPHVSWGIGYALAIFFMQVIRALCMSQSFYKGDVLGGQVKAALVSLIFSKAMKLSGRARVDGRQSGDDQAEPTKPSKAEEQTSGWNNGRITMLMGVEADRVDRACGSIHLLWATPICLAVGLVVLLVTIGYSALSGYAFMFLAVMGLTYIVGSLVSLRVTVNKTTDERVSLTQEIVYNARFVKFFGWENFFLERLRKLRHAEMHSLHKLLAVRHAVISSFVSMSTFAALFAFITYAFQGYGAAPDSIFASFAAFNALRAPLSMMNLVISTATDAWTALDRLQDFFKAEEREDFVDWDMGMRNAIEMNHASFTWEQVPSSTGSEANSTESSRRGSTHESTDRLADANRRSTRTSAEQDPFKISDIDLNVGRRELIAVIGTVGSGKSSLLGALAGEMRLTSGSVRMGTTRALCSQYAWIQNTSVKNNILFGHEYDETRYNQVVDACALRSDLAMFPDGEQTEIGERGITISGGQKQRLNIARAIYSNSELVLLDDPLSAVDAHVGKQIMDNAICGLLRDRCRVLATHQLHVLGRCDRIIVMDQGRIHAVDTFANLMRDDEVFRTIMATTAQLESSDKQTPSHNTEIQPTEEKPKNEGSGTALMQTEERATASMGWAVWKAYISATGSIFHPILFLLLTLLVNGAIIMNGLWLTYWTSDKYPYLGIGGYLGIYAALCVAQFVIVYLYSFQLTYASSNAGKAMLQEALYRVMRAPMSFFDTTPLGRITNRFSKDVQVLDSDLGNSIRMFVMMFSMIVATLGLVVAYFYYFAIAIPPMFFLFWMISSYYRGSARSLKRHEAVLRSGVFARFGEAITGTTCIQAYNREDQFRQVIHKAVDSMNGAYFLTAATQAWLVVRVEMVGAILILIVGILVVTSRFNVGPSEAGMVLSLMLGITQNFQFCVKEYAEVENDMNSVERMHHYASNLDQEAPLELGKVPPSWPENGRIAFDNVEMCYREGMPPVLKGLTMEIRGGERIGIVGRTGAGKSSIMAALFRMSELSSGSIKIDDTDISRIGLHELRTRLTIIPQDPTLFQGTIRSNLDPFDEHTDLELWSALRKAHLVGQEIPSETSTTLTTTSPSLAKPPNPAQRLNLDSTVDQDGLNFSLGQRQLMALARALVRDSRIIVCDEATSSVDFETDERVQETMATGFRDKTVLCIAHRLRTIINYDRICVMDQGRIAEMDTPARLYERRGGIFRGMCEQSGISRGDFAQ